jgi:hypothetical protein
VIEVVAVGLKRARVPLADGDLRLEALQPPAGDGVEAQPRRGRQPSGGERRDQLLAGAPGSFNVVPDSAEMKTVGVTGANRVLAVGLAVDAALDPDAARALGWSHLALLLLALSWPEVDLRLTCDPASSPPVSPSSEKAPSCRSFRWS